MNKLNISLNAECPCRSGEKYKKCHLGKLSKEQEEYFAFLQYNNKIKDKLLRWFFHNLEVEEQDYYAGKFGVENIEVIKYQDNPAEFFEWLFYQAKEKNTNENILRFIIERYPDIFNADELLFIRERANNNQAGIFEVMSSDEKSWEITLKEYNTKEIYKIKDRLGSLDSAIGDYLLTRVEKIFSEYYLCGFGKKIPRRAINEFINFLNKNFKTKKKESPTLAYNEFMNSTFRELTLFEPAPIRFLSNDGNDLKICEGKFTADSADITKMLDFLQKNENFVTIDLSKKKNAYCAEFIKKAIKSKNKERIDNIQEIKSFAMSPQGEKIEYSGSVKIKGDKITIFSSSEKTYREIMNILENFIGKKLELKHESIETPEDILAKDGKKPAGHEKKDSELQGLADEFLKDYYRKWCDEKIPALNNKTPRECTKSDEGKRLLKELLLDVRNLDEHKRKSGELTFSAEGFIRKILNFYE